MIRNANRNALVACLLVGVSITMGFVVGRAMVAEPASAERAVETSRIADPAPDVKWATSNFPKNSSGMTYGSDSEAVEPSEMPDLIAVASDEGRLGFIRKIDLLEADPGNFPSPEAALEWQTQLLASGPPVLQVYDLEGAEQIGTFTLALGEATPDVEKP